ncbi:hypothetical protein [Streptomyces longwoodensis]|uniref:hypothetical protein n=1 Tax=Streptomyces longwoodensis TaxID=68231 RepID=UPI0030E570E8
MRMRRGHPALDDGTLAWQDAPTGVLALRREPGFACVVDLSPEAYRLPAHGSVSAGERSCPGRSAGTAPGGLAGGWSCSVWASAQTG